MNQEMVVNGFALNLSSEEAITTGLWAWFKDLVGAAPRQVVAHWQANSSSDAAAAE